MSKKKPEHHKTISNAQKVEERNRERTRQKGIEIETIERIDDMDFGVDKSGRGVGQTDRLHDERERESKSQDLIRNEMNERRGKSYRK